MNETQTRKTRANLREEGRVLHLVLDAGKGNVIDRDVIAELREDIRINSEHPLYAVLIDHEGPHFSFGASVEEHTADRVREMLPELHALARELLQLDVPVLCAVRGVCLGGGLELALLADRLFAAPGAKFGQPEIALGVFAPLGSALLPRVVGPRRAADLLLSGRSIDHEEAERIGLVGEVAEDPTAAAISWVHAHLEEKSAAALRFATKAARRAWLEDFLIDLELLEREYLDELMLTRDAREGIEAFLQKRPPVWEDE